MLLSHRPEYNDKVSVNIGLAPVVYAKYITSDTLVPICKAANVGSRVTARVVGQLDFRSGVCDSWLPES